MDIFPTFSIHLEAPFHFLPQAEEKLEALTPSLGPPLCAKKESHSIRRIYFMHYMDDAIHLGAEEEKYHIDPACAGNKSGSLRVRDIWIFFLKRSP